MGYNYNRTNKHQDNSMHEREESKSTFTGLDAESHFEECASQYPLDPTAGFVLGISTLLFWLVS
jgi:hypothetical protein